MKTDTERLKARMEGAKAALEGRKMDVNTYDETDDLHFEWLAGWTGARLEKMKSRDRNSRPTRPHYRSPEMVGENSGLWLCKKCGHEFLEADAAKVDVSSDGDEQAIACPKCYANNIDDDGELESPDEREGDH